MRPAVYPAPVPRDRRGEGMRSVKVWRNGSALLVVTGLVVLSCRYVDIPVALFFDGLLRWSGRWRHYTSHIPDALTGVVFIGTALSWLGYYVMRRRGRSHAAGFLQLVGTCLPASLLVKEGLKFVFSRTNTRAWLAHRAPYGFHWFQGGGLYGAFPSGHMVVFSAVGTALWMYYGRFRPLYLGALGALALALVATDYHFVSDVLAGGYVGVMVALASRRFLAQPGRDRH